jgi:hypothetical protein
LTALEDASNGFEHGYLPVDTVRGLVTGVLEQAMRYVRRALIEASGVENATRAVLCDPSYDEPRGLTPVVRFVRGTLRRTDDRPAPDLDVGAIELDWTSAAPQVVSTDSDEVTFTIPTNISVTRVPDRVALDLDGWGLRAANVKVTEPPDALVTRAEEVADAGELPATNVGPQDGPPSPSTN